MKARLFCTHCDKHYEVDVKNINLIKQVKSKNIEHRNNTYYYKNGCFFQELSKIKKARISI
ncbi:MAG: hypothetical protein ACI9TV_001761 [Sulfurimonas sp.]|jgi:hypothetical protein